MRIALLALLLAVPVMAAEPVQVPDVVCDENWCAVRKETLRTLIEGLQKMAEKQVELERLCGWTKP